MAECYKELTGEETTLAKLNELELKVLVALGFDFNFVVEPVDLIRWYLGLMGSNEADHETQNQAVEMMIIQLLDPDMVTQPLSLLSAATSIIAFNKTKLDYLQ